MVAETTRRVLRSQNVVTGLECKNMSLMTIKALQIIGVCSIPSIMSKGSNCERALWRSKSREALAEHISKSIL